MLFSKIQQVFQTGILGYTEAVKPAFFWQDYLEIRIRGNRLSIRTLSYLIMSAIGNNSTGKVSEGVRTISRIVYTSERTHTEEEASE